MLLKLAWSSQNQPLFHPQTVRQNSQIAACDQFITLILVQGVKPCISSGNFHCEHGFYSTKQHFQSQYDQLDMSSRK